MPKICVIGAGVVGMSSAVQIAEKYGRNVQVTVITDQVTPNTTGDGSAGFWGPYYIGQTSASKVTQWSKSTHDFLLDLWQKGKAAEVGICMIPVYRLTTEPGGYPDPEYKNVVFGYTRLNEKQLNQLIKEHGRNYTGGYHAITFTSEPILFLPYLYKRFEEAGGKILRKKIENFEELSNFDIVVNCTGLGSLDLTKDTKMHPIRGQIIRVNAPWAYTVFSDDSDDGNYIIPNTDSVVLGGTHQKNDFNLKVCPKDKEFIQSGCEKILPAIKSSQYLFDFVGLRPGRTEVRMETEKVKTKTGKSLPVVHCVGHGGCGVTLCWGCGEEVLENVTEIMKSLNYKSKL